MILMMAELGERITNLMSCGCVRECVFFTSTLKNSVVLCEHESIYQYLSKLKHSMDILNTPNYPNKGLSVSSF